jgi:CheY-like chemotaxis protein
MNSYTGCQGRTVFVVDDNDQVREMVSFVLECEGMQVLQADGPAKALEMLDCFITPPDLMICDICMPTMSGPELYQLVEKRFPAQPVLFISAYPDDYLKSGCEVVTEKRLLRKPFGSSELVERVEQILESVKGSIPEIAADGDMLESLYMNLGKEIIMNGV